VPRRRSNGVSDPGQPASNIGFEAMLSLRPGDEPRLATQNAAERPVEWRPHKSSVSISVTRASPASRAPRLAPAIPPPTINMSQTWGSGTAIGSSAIFALGYELESRTV
jgi:hypothetical protein